MKPQQLVRAGTPTEVTVLAVMALLLSVGCASFFVHPLGPDVPRVLVAVIAACGVVIAVTLLLLGPAVRPAHLHVSLVLLTALRGALVAGVATERGLMLSALGFAWTAVYVGVFFRPEVARAYAGLLTVTLGAALIDARAPTDVSVWLTISAMVWVATAVLSRLNDGLRAEAHTDPLTGLLNRTGFATSARRERAMAERRGDPVTLVVIDLDGFKAVNDREGHPAGDRLLAELGAAWTSVLRPGDLLARFGGDEFVLLLPGLDLEAVDEVLARLARAHPAPWTSGAVSADHGEALDLAIARADTELYRAKDRRRAAAASALTTPSGPDLGLQPGTACTPSSG